MMRAKFIANFIAKSNLTMWGKRAFSWWNWEIFFPLNSTDLQHNRKHVIVVKRLMLVTERYMKIQGVHLSLNVKSLSHSNYLAWVVANFTLHVHSDHVYLVAARHKWSGICMTLTVHFCTSVLYPVYILLCLLPSLFLWFWQSIHNHFSLFLFNLWFFCIVGLPQIWSSDKQSSKGHYESPLYWRQSHLILQRLKPASAQEAPLSLVESHMDKIGPSRHLGWVWKILSFDINTNK